MTILYFILALGILVLLHEFGHFLAAKRQGIGVEKFSLGFGPKLIGVKWGETTYLVSALPLGGYVKLRGEDPEGEEAKEAGSFSARPIRQRFRVVLAGPLMNLLLALLLMPAVFWIGRWQPFFFEERPVVIGVKADSPAQGIGMEKGDEILSVDGKEVRTWREFLDRLLLKGKEEMEISWRRRGQVFSKRLQVGESPETFTGVLGVEPTFFLGNEAVVDEVALGGPAEAAGIRPGDEVLEIDGVAVGGWSDMSEKIHAGGGRSLAFTIRRAGKILSLTANPRFDDSLKRWLIGVRKGAEKREGLFEKRRYPFRQAILRGMKENVRLMRLTTAVLGRLVTFRLSYKTLGGPIRIAQASAMAAKSGLTEFLYFLAFLSLQLGLLNLLPIPVLDGGHLLFFGIEGIRRRPLSARVRGVAEQAGFLFLIGLMLLVTVNDMESVWGLRGIWEKIRNLF